MPSDLAGCAYAAWSGAGGYLIDCADASRDVNEDFSALDSASRAVFRINRKVIVLNNPEDGGLWLPDEDMVQVDNWDQINSDLEKEETEEDDTTRNADETQAERSENNTPPDAVDDSFGVRPGRSASLPVIANDTDPDGDVLVASPTSQPDLGEVVAVGDGAALQARIRDGAAGSSTFTYELDDGTATDTAGVTLTVHPWETNAGPEQLSILSSNSIYSGNSFDVASGGGPATQVPGGRPSTNERRPGTLWVPGLSRWLRPASIR